MTTAEKAYKVSELLRRVHGMGRLASEWYAYRRLGRIEGCKPEGLEAMAKGMALEWPHSSEARELAGMR